MGILISPPTNVGSDLAWRNTTYSSAQAKRLIADTVLSLAERRGQFTIDDVIVGVGRHEEGARWLRRHGVVADYVIRYVISRLKDDEERRLIEPSYDGNWFQRVTMPLTEKRALTVRHFKSSVSLRNHAAYLNAELPASEQIKVKPVAVAK